TKGFTKELEISGVGYKAEVKGKSVVFSLGYSHPVDFPIPEGIAVTIDAKAGKMTVTGAGKQKGGHTAAEEVGRANTDAGTGQGKQVVERSEQAHGRQGGREVVMNRSQARTEARSRIRIRVRQKVRGASERPRLAVYKSGRHIYAQVVDDGKGATLAHASSLD